jgi:serine/threonine protein kinase
MKGSPLYMAPELVERSEGCSKVDVFSMGCVLYQLAYDGDSPFYSSSINFRSREDYFEHVKTAELILKQKNKKGEPRSLELRQLISMMLEKNSSKRISWEQIFAHNRIRLNQIHIKKQERTPNNEEKELDTLKIILDEVGRSSAKLEQLPEK